MCLRVTEKRVYPGVTVEVPLINVEVYCTFHRNYSAFRTPEKFLNQNYINLQVSIPPEVPRTRTSISVRWTSSSVEPDYCGSRESTGDVTTPPPVHLRSVVGTTDVASGSQGKWSAIPTPPRGWTSDLVVVQSPCCTRCTGP